MPRQSGTSAGLPGYAYDTRLRNYVNAETGRMVSRTDITNLLRDVTAGSEARLAEYGRLAANGAMTPRQFYEAMQREVKTMTNANAALAKGGWAQMTPSDWGRNGAQLREEYGRLRAFAAEIEAGNLTPAQIEARAQLYANTTYARYWQIRTEQEVAAGVMQERLVTMGDDRVCEICQGEAARSWVPVGTYNPPIHAGCRCDVDYQSGG